MFGAMVGYPEVNHKRRSRKLPDSEREVGIAVVTRVGLPRRPNSLPWRLGPLGHLAVFQGADQCGLGLVLD